LSKDYNKDSEDNEEEEEIQDSKLKDSEIEEDEEPEYYEEEMSEKEGEIFKTDALGFVSFLTFILIVFFLLFSWWNGSYPFTAVPSYSIIGFLKGYIVVLQDYITFYVLYWISLACLIIGLWRYKYEWWLFTLIGILGAMMFFMFFV